MYYENKMEELVRRARILLLHMSETGVAEHLMADGVSKEDAFLAVKGAQVLNKEHNT